MRALDKKFLRRRLLWQLGKMVEEQSTCLDADSGQADIPTARLLMAVIHQALYDIECLGMADISGHDFADSESAKGYFFSENSDLHFEMLGIDKDWFCWKLKVILDKSPPMRHIKGNSISAKDVSGESVAQVQCGKD